MLSIALIKLEQNCFEVKRIADDMQQQVEQVKSSYKIIQINRDLKTAQLSKDQMQNILLEFQQKLSYLECMMNQIMGLKDIFTFNLNQLLESELNDSQKSYNQKSPNVHIEYYLERDQKQNQNDIKIEENQFDDNKIFYSSFSSSKKKSNNDSIQKEQTDQKNQDEQVQEFDDDYLFESGSKLPQDTQKPNLNLNENEQYSHLNLFNRKIVKKQPYKVPEKILDEKIQHYSIKNLYDANVFDMDQSKLRKQKDNKKFSNDSIAQCIDYLQKNKQIDWGKVYESWRQLEQISKMKIPNYFYTADFRNNLKIKGVTSNLSKQEILDLFELSKLFRSQSAFSKFLQLSRDQIGKMFKRKLGVKLVEQKSIFQCFNQK
ncbi:hypothetical protein TTHERM_01109990 (macronuclear) [Tetrahymena thermophila SB210]|uniref:Uncharacterized protein n=1 Tax=Tetrahymena thermophila (strain SB210) TaxID=312017 RepID=Q22B56_TETTS|nr:hypothetical protein TTHERM_01109990 [Tetrahymena thermophila SB210]EAR82545.2 hypothetical protein TTHERM_01109990 [Tetrahymena thermophila SB210]|eukprot:XP_001030208.2 hypothetical protein TTHERM_01109990 [Tetrahymena thermophila SB210]